MQCHKVAIKHALNNEPIHYTNKEERHTDLIRVDAMKYARPTKCTLKGMQFIGTACVIPDLTLH